LWFAILVASGIVLVSLFQFVRITLASVYQGAPFAVGYRTQEGNISAVSMYTGNDVILMRMPSSIPVNESPVLIDASLSVDPASLTVADTFFRCAQAQYEPTGMTWLDCLRLWWDTRSIKQETYEWTQAEDLPFTSKQLVDERLYKEGIAISIVNATGENGIGSLVGDRLKQIGAHVVSITASSPQEQTELFVQIPSQQSYTARRLETLFDVSLKDNTAASAVAPMSLVIGREWVQR
jgi:hypothetical protein